MWVLIVSVPDHCLSFYFYLLAFTLYPSLFCHRHLCPDLSFILYSLWLLLARLSFSSGLLFGHVDQGFHSLRTGQFMQRDRVGDESPKPGSFC